MFFFSFHSCSVIIASKIINSPPEANFSKRFALSDTQNNIEIFEIIFSSIAQESEARTATEDDEEEEKKLYCGPFFDIRDSKYPICRGMQKKDVNLCELGGGWDGEKPILTSAALTSNETLLLYEAQFSP